MKKLIILLITISFLSACSTNTQKNTDNKPVFDSSKDYSILMAETVLKKYPDVWSIEDRTEPKWSYTYGLVSMAMVQLYKETNNEDFLNYAKLYADTMIDATGKIEGYEKTLYNIDKLNSGKFLFDLVDMTGKQAYNIAIDTLRNQLYDHPRTEIGGFWHKKRYPHQMWLDGVYMGAPFYAQYALQNNEPEDFNEIGLWIKNVYSVTYDVKTGLLYHAWDESKEQAWANKETGCASNFWGRGMGWYAMALVDVLDYFPKNHPDYQSILNITKEVAKTIVKYQDQETGAWYQVLDQGNREGNYLEASASAMFSYFLLKAINKDYIAEHKYSSQATKSYEGIINNLMVINNDQTISLTPVCAVAGLGGNPYRDGTYEYYINESKRDNDPKAVGPFILAGIEYKHLTK